MFTIDWRKWMNIQFYWCKYFVVANQIVFRTRFTLTVEWLKRVRDQWKMFKNDWRKWMNIPFHWCKYFCNDQLGRVQNSFHFDS